MRADARRNRERILDGARAVFAERGRDAQMDDVARAAGVGVGTVYRHFPDKEALMAELIRRKFVLFAERARAALEREGEPFDVFAELLREHLELTARDAASQYALMEAPDRAWEQSVREREELNVRAGTMREDFGVEDIPMLMCGISASMSCGLDWRRHFELMLSALRA
jgi:AcrR family transcriptional regulator